MPGSDVAMRRCAGFSLVELMVTLLIGALLALAGMLVASDWGDGNRQMQARNVVWEAVSQARAAALRNPCRAGAGAVAATATLRQDDTDPDVTKLVVSSPSEEPDCDPADGETRLWSGTLPKGTTLKLAGQESVAGKLAWVTETDELTCVAFDNRGDRVVSSENACDTPLARGSIAIGYGNQEDLHVDLL